VFGNSGLGWLVGFLQFLPWFLGPLLFISGAFAWTWHREVFASLLLFVDKVLFVLMVGLQVRLNIAVPDPQCTDVFGTLHGFPCVAAVRLGFYLGVALIMHRWLWLNDRQRHYRPSWTTLGTLLVIPLLIFVGLLVNNLNTSWQVFASFVIGLVVAMIVMLMVRTLLYPYVIRPYVKATDSRAHQDYLHIPPRRPPPHVPPNDPEPPLLHALFGAHDRLLEAALYCQS